MERTDRPSRLPIFAPRGPRAGCDAPGCELPRGDACSPGAAPRERPLARREFLALAGAGAAGLAAGLPAFAGPFAAADFETLVPADKKLAPEWVRSLFERGEPQVVRGGELLAIGMPVGGISTGQLYLGGDGKLWHWDIFRSRYRSDYAGMARGIHYAQPLAPSSPLEQGFAIRVAAMESAPAAPARAAGAQIRELDRRGFREIAFRGEYPIGRVQYSDPDCPVTVRLEAFSPFIPLDPESSGLPATVMHYTVRNRSGPTLAVEVAGWIENGVCPGDRDPALGLRRNRVHRRDRVLTLECSAEPEPRRDTAEPRPDIVFEDFETETYQGWTAAGTAFGSGPVRRKEMPAYQGDVGAHGERLVNSHHTRSGEDVRRGDAHTGTLTSRPFRIERRYIAFLIGGGHHPGKTCLELLVGGEVVRSTTGHDANRLRPEAFAVADLEGREAQLRIVDTVTGGWGNIGVDRIVFTDRPPFPTRLEERHGFGTLALSLLGAAEGDRAAAEVPGELAAPAVFAALGAEPGRETAARSFSERIAGALGRRFLLGPGEERDVTFLVTWCFPDVLRPDGEWASIQDITRLGRHYGTRFESARAVAASVAERFDALAAATRLWERTWYDSTLPYWFLDRTFANTSTLATQTCHWFSNGRFWGWEGVYCCPGTCQHVWQYAQAVARIFPSLERATREMVDYGIAYHDSGALDYRAESARTVAADGQAGTILRVYREHQMSPDSGFLARIWTRVRRSLEYLIGEDGDENGLLEGRQYNTLDAAWYGPMAWISSLYVAALLAGREMARDMGDEAFAARCEAIAGLGRRNLVEKLFSGEYFVHRPDPAHPEATSTGAGCHIDQLFGQSYALQLGLGRVVPPSEARSALRALWKYNYTPDVGPYRENFKAIRGGRWYALPGEGGLLMCTWPRGGAEKAPGKGNPTFVGYFNECMTGFEYQVAAHMIWEGLVEEGLAVARTIHDRYHPSKRNPFNEIECSDHYARAMASYGVYLAACGYEYHGPRGYLAFAPRLEPERFRAAFTAAEGWGSFAQRWDGDRLRATVEMRWGRLKVRELAFETPGGAVVAEAAVTVAGEPIAARLEFSGGRARISLAREAVVPAGRSLEVVLA